MFASLWKVMKENKFEFDDEISSDLICKICKCLIIKACNSPCGCRFCFDCIEHYLNGNNKFCPGAARFCHLQTIHFEKNISEDHPANFRISETVVKCPRENCQFTDELGMIESHMKMCNKGRISCPFLGIGCGKNEIINEEMQAHLNEDNYYHTKLLIDLINNLRNEMESMKLNICEMERKEIESKGEIAKLKKEILAVKDENRFFRSGNEANVKLIDEMRRQIETIQTKFQPQIEDNQNYDKENIKAGLRKTVSKIQGIQAKFEIENFGILEWKIENLSQKFDTLLFSEPFYSGRPGYKMCLSINVKSNENYINFHLMVGETDTKLTWPFRSAVTIDAIDPENGNILRSKTMKYSDNTSHSVWLQPVNERNNGINIITVPSDSRAIINDKLTVKCRVNL